jgi:hypothetical protein
MRGWVCRLQLLLVLASAVILRSESCGTRDHVLLSEIRDSPKPGGPGPRIYIPQEQGGPVIPPGTGFLSPPTTRRATMEVFDTGMTSDCGTLYNRLLYSRKTDNNVEKLILCTERKNLKYD